MKKNIIKVMYEFGDALDFDHLYELVHNINLYALSGNKNNDLLDKIISKSLLDNRNLSEINEILKEVYCKNINSSEINIC